MTSTMSNATSTDLKAALAYLHTMREQCLNEDGDELPGAVTAAMLVASTKLPREQFGMLIELLQGARESGEWEPCYMFTGDVIACPDGSELTWVINAQAKEGHAHDLSIYRDGEEIVFTLMVPGPTEDDGMRTLYASSELRMHREEVLKLLAS